MSIITDAPTKRGAVWVFVGALPPRRVSNIVDAPTKQAADSILVGAPSPRRVSIITDAPTKRAAECIFVGAPATLFTPVTMHLSFGQRAQFEAAYSLN